jgi:hypothetical protein
VELGRCRAVGDPSCLIDVTLDSLRRRSAAGTVSSE